MEIITIIKIQSVRLKKVELSVPPLKKNEVQETKVLTSDDHAHIKQLWTKFQNMIHKLDEKDTPPGISGDKEKNKRDRSVSVTDKDYDKDLDLDQHNTKWIRNYQDVTSKFEVHAPRHISRQIYLNS